MLAAACQPGHASALHTCVESLSRDEAAVRGPCLCLRPGPAPSASAAKAEPAMAALLSGLSWAGSGVKADWRAGLGLHPGVFHLVQGAGWTPGEQLGLIP